MNGRHTRLVKHNLGHWALSCVLFLFGSGRAAGQAGLNTGMMWKTPLTTSYPLSCQALRTANPAAESGIYTIDPDDAYGPCPPLSVYCDMTYNDGGWTLIASSNGVDHSLPVVQAITSTTSAGLLDAMYVKPLAWRASSIRITAGPLADGVYVMSSASGTLRQLRAYQILNDPEMMGAQPNTAWTGATGIMEFGCGPGGGFAASLAANLYQACGNTGLHWHPGGSHWTLNSSISNLDLWVK